MSWWGRVLCGVLCGIAGLIVLLVTFSPSEIPGVIPAIFAGAFTSGMVHARFFGRRGWEGTWCAFWAAIGATLLGAALSGICFLVGFALRGGLATADGITVLMVISFIAGFVAPKAVAMWAVTMAIVHFAMAMYRKEIECRVGAGGAHI